MKAWASFVDLRRRLNSLRLDLPALDEPVSSIMPLVRFTTLGGSGSCGGGGGGDLSATPSISTASEASSSPPVPAAAETAPAPPAGPDPTPAIHPAKNTSAAYWLATVAHAAPAAPPNHRLPARGTSATSPRRLTSAAAPRTYSGLRTSCMPRLALWAVPMVTAAGMPRARTRTYRRAAPNTSGSIPSFPMRSRRRGAERAYVAAPKATPTPAARRRAATSVDVVRGIFLPAPPPPSPSRGSSSSSCTAAATRFVVAVYMNATTRAP
mmetsp:Transcript_10441/g.24358  ORF Transcript_10441/g.24358 Transcript_10441/m.24358 type:complete len:267 (-) Transcript_10441:1690-2490(-)